MMSFADDILMMSTGVTLQKLADNKTFQYSILYPLGQIGELAIAISESAKRSDLSVEELHPEVEWADWRGFRNRNFHDYDQINLRIVLEMIEEAVPLLLQSLTTITQRYS